MLRRHGSIDFVDEKPHKTLSIYRDGNEEERRRRYVGNQEGLFIGEVEKAVRAWLGLRMVGRRPTEVLSLRGPGGARSAVHHR